MVTHSVADGAGVIDESDLIRAAQQVLRARHKDGLAALDTLFRAGTVPKSLAACALSMLISFCMRACEAVSR